MLPTREINDLVFTIHVTVGVYFATFTQTPDTIVFSPGGSLDPNTGHHRIFPWRTATQKHRTPSYFFPLADRYTETPDTIVFSPGGPLHTNTGHHRIFPWQTATHKYRTPSYFPLADCCTETPDTIVFFLWRTATQKLLFG